MSSERKILDANEAVASVAYRLSEIVSIYPITPSSTMAEHCDEWSAAGKINLWGDVPQVIQLQSEAGAAGTLHGSLMGGSLGTTFTASQGLLLMLPNMFKIAGELTPSVIHVSARAIATHALSIFGDHSDVMACRSTGFAMLASNNVQEAQDFAAIAHAATLKSRVPFLHFFDGFRTSHEINDIEPIDNAVLNSLVDEDSLLAFHQRALSPDTPSVRGTAHNPDTYFQGREAVNPFYKDATDAVVDLMEKFGQKTGRKYAPFEYYGAPDATMVIVIMGSGAETVEETVKFLNQHHGPRYGVLKVRLYRPFNTKLFNEALPNSVQRIAVLDRTKEPGSIGEPLYLDVGMALRKANTCLGKDLSPDLVLIGGRYGLGSKEFTPGMAKAVFDELCAHEPRDHFTVGINDDVSRRSLHTPKNFNIEPEATTRALFFGLGSDGTVGANKNTIKIIGENTPLHTQAYFVYDSKKSGGLTSSHLRFGSEPIKAPYLISQAQFIACHQPQFLSRVKMLDFAAPKSTFLVNSPHPPETFWSSLSGNLQATIIEKEIRVFHIDANKLAAELGLGGRTNTIMQTAFFALSGLLPVEAAVNAIKAAITKTYGRKGPQVVELNCKAVDVALENLNEVKVPPVISSAEETVTFVPNDAPDFVRRVTARLLAGEGDLLPVSAFPVDGVWPSGTSRFEKRNIATALPIWNADACTQCNRCTLFCPHSAIRPKVYESSELEGAPAGFVTAGAKTPGAGKDQRFTIQLYAEDCTGCTVCSEVCPATDANGRKAIDMETATTELVASQNEQLAFFENITAAPLPTSAPTARTVTLREPLFEFSGACSGCTQTPYVRTLSQLFGDRMLVANATGCSSIYGGNLPTTPWCKNSEGRGPAWANSLFEDNAEFGLGLHLSVEARRKSAQQMLERLRPMVGDLLTTDILSAKQESDADIANQRARIDVLKKSLQQINSPVSRLLLANADYLVRKTTWIVGGDGWAYDIGFGGLDHILASGQNVNVLVLDTEVYSNTGGQSSKATPIGAQAKFAAAGKQLPKKDLAQIAMSYQGVYVAQIAFGANERQAVEVLREAEAFDGPSLVIAYGPCLAHGIDLKNGPARQKAAVDSGYWPLFRFDPRRAVGGESPLRLDSMEPSVPVAEFMQQENRFRVLQRSNPGMAEHFFTLAQEQVDKRWSELERRSLATVGADEDDDEDDGWG